MRRLNLGVRLTRLYSHLAGYLVPACRGGRWGRSGAPNENVVQNHLNIALLNGCVTAVQIILIFANYSPSIAIELKVSKELTCK